MHKLLHENISREVVGVTCANKTALHVELAPQVHLMHTKCNLKASTHNYAHAHAHAHTHTYHVLRVSLFCGFTSDIKMVLQEIVVRCYLQKHNEIAP